MGGGSSSCMSAAEGWDMEDVYAANKALDRWQLIQKGHTAEEADALLADEEAKRREAPIDMENCLMGRLGGPGNIKWIFADFYKRIMTETKVNSFFEGVDMSMIRGMPVRMSAFMCHVFSGPDQFEKPYRGQNVHSYMRKIHIPLIRDHGLSVAHFEVLCKHMEHSLEAAQVNSVIVQEALAVFTHVKACIFEPGPGEPPGMTDRPDEPYKGNAIEPGFHGMAIAVAEGTEGSGPDAAAIQVAKKCPFSGYFVRK